jgi:hypothetical protein
MPEQLWLVCCHMCFIEVDLDGVGQVGEIRCDVYVPDETLDVVMDF